MLIGRRNDFAHPGTARFGPTEPGRVTADDWGNRDDTSKIRTPVFEHPCQPSLRDVEENLVFRHVGRASPSRAELRRGTRLLNTSCPSPRTFTSRPFLWRPQGNRPAISRKVHIDAFVHGQIVRGSRNWIPRHCRRRRRHVPQSAVSRWCIYGMQEVPYDVSRPGREPGRVRQTLRVLFPDHRLNLFDAAAGSRL